LWPTRYSRARGAFVDATVALDDDHATVVAAAAADAGLDEDPAALEAAAAAHGELAARLADIVRELRADLEAADAPASAGETAASALANAERRHAYATRSCHHLQARVERSALRRQQRAAVQKQQRASLKQPQLAALRKLQRTATAGGDRAADDDAAARAAAAADDEDGERTDVLTHREKSPSPPAPDDASATTGRTGDDITKSPPSPHLQCVVSPLSSLATHPPVQRQSHYRAFCRRRPAGGGEARRVQAVLFARLSLGCLALDDV
jgi:hypothetical protein